MTKQTHFFFEVYYRPIRRWSGFDIKEFFYYKDFLLLLIWRNIAVRYRQTVIGVGWVVLQPVVNLFVFTLVFNRMAGIQSVPGLPYPVFLMTGLLFWQYFATAVTFASNALIDNTELVNKVYVPRYMLPMAVVLSIGIDFCIGVILLLFVSFLFGAGLSISFLLMLPLLFAELFLVVVGAGLILSSINAQFRDVRFVVPFFMQVFFYLTPVFYPIDILNDHPFLKQILIFVNPLAGVITVARSFIVGGSFDMGLWGISLGVSTGIFFLGWIFFRNREKILADII